MTANRPFQQARYKEGVCGIGYEVRQVIGDAALINAARLGAVVFSPTILMYVRILNDFRVSAAYASCLPYEKMFSDKAAAGTLI